MADSKQVLPKVIAKKIGTDLDKVSIDYSVIDMLRSLELPENSNNFNESLSIYSEKLASSLREAHRYLAQQDEENLEKTAQELSHNALRIGAVRILRSSYELQNVARCKDFGTAELIVQGLELEYLRVRQDLENVV